MSPEPEILDEAAIVDDERALERRGPIDLMQVPRLLGGALADIRTIAEGMATLPRLLVSLDGIRARVDSLDEEVRQMRAAVEAMGVDVARLEPHLEEVTRIAHPLRRLNPARRRASGGS